MNPASDPTSEQFGPYEVYERLGMGGMATVHRAMKRGPAGFERSVALKRMLAHLAEDPSFVESFIREAKVASLLQHPNIAQVYDFGRISGIYYIAMELVAGFDVRKLLRYANRANEAIPMPVILSILGELCDALDYAHTFVDGARQPLHIIHRDISPSNLIVASTGHIKVIDFGIAKANSRQLHTESGQVKGKLGYMSPEVALGMSVGPVSDIFSVGVVAWELVTASPLFSARTDFETMRKIREEPVARPSQLNSACPPRLDRLILAALEREPDMRLASARLLRQALDEIAAETGTHVSARAVAEWMVTFAQPGDSRARGRGSSSDSRPRSPSGRPLPLPPAQATAVIRGTKPAIQLRRSSAHIQLATEIWGENGCTVEDADPDAAPDFHRHVATPLPAQVQSLISAAPITEQRASKKPLAILGVLALIAAALGGVLIWQHWTTIEKGTLRFQIEPAGAQVTVAGAPLANTSPLEATLAAGVYPITVELDGYTPWSGEVTVRKGDSQTIRVALDKAQTEIAIHDPPAANDSLPQPAAYEPTREPLPSKRISAQKVAPKREPKKGTARINKVAPKVAEVPKREPKPEPTVEPPKVEPPKVEPPKPPEPPVDVKPVRTPVVAANAVTKLSGDVPTLRTNNAEGSGDVLAKLCIDEQGRVASVKIVKSNPEITTQLQSALVSWRYKPYTRDGKPLAVCFPLSLRVVVKSS